MNKHAWSTFHQHQYGFNAGRDWGQEGKRTAEDEMAGWHHWLDGRGFGWTPGVGNGQGGLACCDSWGHKQSDTTERLNWTELKEFVRNTRSQARSQIYWIRTWVEKQISSVAICKLLRKTVLLNIPLIHWFSQDWSRACSVKGNVLAKQRPWSHAA